MNKSKLEDEVFYGEQVELIVSNPAYQAAIARMKANLFSSFERTTFFDRRERHAIWRMIKTITNFEEELEVMLRDAHMAKEDLQRIEKLKSVR